MPVELDLRLIPTSPSSTRELSQLLSSTCRSCVTHPTSPVALPASPCFYRSRCQTSPFLPCPQHAEESAPAPHASQTTAAAVETLLPAQLSTRQEAVAAWPRAGTGSHHKPAVRFAHQRPRLAPHPGYSANPLMQVFMAPLPTSHNKKFCLRAPSLPMGCPRDRKGN